MNWLRGMRGRFRALFQRERVEQDMAEELRSHIELQTGDNVQAGMRPEEARLAALQQFGSIEPLKERCRDERYMMWLDHLLQDVRYGIRTLRRSPGFTAVSVATLALGLGVNTALFSIISAVLLQPLPYPNPEQLVQLDQSNRKDAILSEYGVSVPNYRDWRAMSHSFSHLGIHFYDDFWLTEGERVRPVRAWYFSAEMIPALGVRPLVGRGFSEDDEKAEDVALVGYDLWQHVLGGRTNLAGATVVVNNRRLQVVGIMPRGFNFPARMELWLPLPGSKKEFQNRGWMQGRVIGRLKAGVSVSRAQAEMDTIARQLESQYPQFKDWGIRVTSLHDKAIAPVRPALPILVGVALFVLLIACANLGNLLLSRSLARQKELAIRAAVGAGNARLIRQLLTESLLLSGFGAAAGFLAVLWTRGLWAGLVGPHLPRFALIRIDFSVWWYTLAVAVLTGLGCGLIPAWRIWRTNLQQDLKDGGQRSVAEHSGGWLRSGLVVSQVSLALVLLIGAGLALRSVYHLLHPGLSVDPNKVLVMDVQLPKAGYPEDAQRLAFFEQLKERLKAWPTVEASGAASFMAFGSGMRSPMSLKDRPNDPPRWTFSCDVSPDFFKAIGIPLLRGRDLSDQDRKGGPRVALINETMARRYWPGEDPIGKQFGGPDNWITVVGVVRDLRPGGIESARRAEYYNCWYQSSFINTLVVRTAVDPAKVTGQLTALFHDMDKTLPTPDAQTLGELLDDVASDTRALLGLLGIFGGLAVVLAVVGIYGVIAYAVTQRRHEFGIRMALGARKMDVVCLVLKWGGRLALTGTAVGLILAWACTRLMTSLIEGISPRDAITFASVPWVLLLFAFLGCYVPARKAARADPLAALRYE